MSKYSEIFNYMRKCPQLNELWSIAATEESGVNVVLPQGSSDAFQYNSKKDIYGNFECEIIPHETVFEDYQINCYRIYDAKDNSAPEGNINVIALDGVQEICDWVSEQNLSGNLPQITGKTVFAVECKPFVPQIRYVDPVSNTIAYFITVRIHYINDLPRRCLSLEVND